MKLVIPILKNPYVLSKMIDTNRRILCPHWLELIEEGQKDGSIHTQYARNQCIYFCISTKKTLSQ